MSEWIDFSVYATSNIVLWIMLPLAYRGLAVPVLLDRNPEWVAANPEAVQRIARSYWFNNSCIAWGVASVAVLLLVQLGVHVPGAKEYVPLWQRLNGINNLLFILGFVGFAVVMFFAQRRLNRWIPPGVRRSASLQPRSAANLVPFRWRIATEVLTVGFFATWIIVGLMGIARSPKFWGGFVFLLFMSVLFAVMAHASAQRPPNYMDRFYGAAYRRREVRVLYGIRLAILAFGAIALISSVVGSEAMPMNPVRLGYLLFQVLFVACLLAFMLIKPAGSVERTNPPGLAVSLIMLIAVPIIAAASTSMSIPAKCCAASTPSFRALPVAVSADLPWAGRWLR